MIEQLQEIEFDDAPGRKVWRLPYRDTSEFRWLGWVITGFGAIACLFMISWISGPLAIGANMVFQQQQVFGWVLIGFSLLGIGGLMMAVRMLSLGRRIVKNRTRCEVCLQGKWLIASEELGWLDWRRKRRIDTIDDFEIRRAGDKRWSKTGSVKKLSTSLADMTAIIARSESKANDDNENEKADEFIVAIGYASELCEQLANEIASEMGSVTSGDRLNVVSSLTSRTQETTSNEVSNTPTVTIADATDQSVEPTLPEDSCIDIHDDSSGAFACDVPPVGIMKGSKGIFLFALVWLAFVGVFIAILIVNYLKKGDAEYAGFAIMTLFLLAGIGMLLCAINLGRRSLMMAKLGDQLSIRRRSIFGEKWLEIDRNDILDIDVGNSGTEVNDVPLQELKIWTASRKRAIGLLSQLSDEELEWLAWKLRRALNVVSTDEIPSGKRWQAIVSRRKHGTDSSGYIALPEDSPIRIDVEGYRTDILVPRKGIKHFILPTALWIVFIATMLIFWSEDAPPGILLACGWAGSVIFTGLLIGIAIWALRSFEIRAEPNTLDIVRKDFFGRKHFAWFRSEIEFIDIRSSGVISNEEKQMQLHIQGDSELKMMTGWSVNEVAIVAAHLNRALRMDAKAEKTEGDQQTN